MNTPTLKTERILTTRLGKGIFRGFRRKLYFLCIGWLLAPAIQAAAPPLRIALLGDSTVCHYPTNNLKRGWGTYLEGQFPPGAVKVFNFASGGCSTKTFREEGRWEMAQAVKPDVVIIQFGHNDSHAKDKPEATDAATEFRANLRRYVTEARALGATPILVTPMHRRMFNADGTLNDNLQPYAEAMKAVAAEQGAALIDLHAMSGELLARLGAQASEAFANELGDRTHFNERGAQAMAELVMRELPKAEPRIGKLLQKDASPRRQPAAIPVVSPKAAPFSPADVRLLDGPFKLSRDADVQYLLSLNVDRLLAPYLIEAGLEPKAMQYPGWETNTLPGVGLGFYLSGISHLAKSTENQEFVQRLNYILDQLEICQQATGGYLLGTRNGRAIFARVEKEGKFEGFAPWGKGEATPYYALEKIFSGLRDAYRNAGMQKALQIEVKLGDWLDRHMSHLSDAQIADLMTVEFGGMNWVLSDLYADTGDARYLALSRRWQDNKVFAGPAAEKNDLVGKHANTQFPKFAGLAARYPFSGDSADLKTAAFFWESVTRHHSYVTGGNSVNEHFSPADNLNDHLSQHTAENCNSYNMLRLTQLLFNVEPKPEYASFMERTLFNHILAAQDVRDGRVCYFLPLASGASRAPHSLYNDFSCCVCSGFDSYSRNSSYIYSHSADGLYVNLFVASEVNWKDKGLVLRQETKFPDSDLVTFRLSLQQPKRFSLYLRYPAWATEGISVQVNGAAQKVAVAPGEFFALDREWRDGDTVVFQAPLALRYETMPDNQDRIALFAGPILLAGNLGPVVNPASEDPDYVPLLVPDGKPVSQWVQATGAALTFKTTVARPREVELQPFFRLHDCSYAVYWDRKTAAGWKAHLLEVEKQRDQARQLADRTVDKISVGDLASEKAHQFKPDPKMSYPDAGNKGLMMHLNWRIVLPGQTASYRVKSRPDKLISLQCRYLNNPYPNFEFDIQVDGTTIAQVKIKDYFGGIMTVEYPVPPELTKGKDEIEVVFRATNGKTSAKISELRVLKASTL